ncbi:DUF3850 domain-containing protein [Serratia proteamaculans]|uniref:DUF3850 domain-containing protein n=1 Tax=Serratia proteamaculans TaxID=28151 RepID=UPI00217CB092|nr:DUF3850 domain-containing protein [Serratia proteamaculans]CAI0904182.1 Domain of Uncharacterised Function with PDB structure [Serratia proteamaculans]CAI0965269.1 Domain of Uncharacterised Function with PDB structure [Serratia proteamaculans]
MTLHDLKIKPSYFNFVRAGVKKAEFLLNDRDFKEGDLLKLREWLEDANGYTGEFILVKVTHITDLSEWKAGYVVLSIQIQQDSMCVNCNERYCGNCTYSNGAIIQ